MIEAEEDDDDDEVLRATCVPGSPAGVVCGQSSRKFSQQSPTSWQKRPSQWHEPSADRDRPQRPRQERAAVMVVVVVVVVVVVAGTVGEEVVVVVVVVVLGRLVKERPTVEVGAPLRAPRAVSRRHCSRVGLTR